MKLLFPTLDLPATAICFLSLFRKSEGEAADFINTGFFITLTPTFFCFSRRYGNYTKKGEGKQAYAEGQGKGYPIAPFSRSFFTL